MVLRGVHLPHLSSTSFCCVPWKFLPVLNPREGSADHRACENAREARILHGPQQDRLVRITAALPGLLPAHPLCWALLNAVPFTSLENRVGGARSSTSRTSSEQGLAFTLALDTLLCRSERPNTTKPNKYREKLHLPQKDLALFPGSVVWKLYEPKKKGKHDSGRQTPPVLPSRPRPTTPLLEFQLQLFYSA